MKVHASSVVEMSVTEVTRQPDAQNYQIIAPSSSGAVSNKKSTRRSDIVLTLDRQTTYKTGAESLVFVNVPGRVG